MAPPITFLIFIKNLLDLHPNPNIPILLQIMVRKPKLDNEVYLFDNNLISKILNNILNNKPVQKQRDVYQKNTHSKVYHNCFARELNVKVLWLGFF